MLIYLTSWQEEEFSIKIHRSWKGYPFEILNELQEENYISGSKRAKSVFMTKEGIIKVEEFKGKYLKER